MLAGNPFTSSAFNGIALTKALNLLPNRYGLLEQMKLMPFKPTRLRNISIEERNGTLSLLQTARVGEAGILAGRDKRTVRSFIIPHIPHNDNILPEEIQGLRAFGTEDELAAMSQVVADHLQAMRDKHAITLEYLRMGALKGLINDADGTLLYNLYTEFSITQKVVDFAFSVATTDVKAVCLSIVRYIEENLLGEFKKGVKCLVSPEFFDLLTGHDTVKAAYDRWQNGAALRDDMRDSFYYGGINFQEYNGTASDVAGTARRFIAASEGHAFPLGTVNTFSTYCAPGDFNHSVNTLGQPLYASQVTGKHNRGIELHTQSNPLPMCHRPALLVKVTTS